MPPFRPVSEDFSVSPQISEADVREAAAAGFTLIINNRPDGEDPAQPPAMRIEAAARAAGLDYLHIPIVGRPGPEAVTAMREAIVGAKGKVLAYCRSGTRSIVTWALGADVPRETLVRLGEAAGYDLSGVLPP